MELAREAALDAAGAAFAALILTGSANIVRHGSANLAEGDLQLVEVEELDEVKAWICWKLGAGLTGPAA